MHVKRTVTVLALAAAAFGAVAPVASVAPATTQSTCGTYYNYYVAYKQKSASANAQGNKALAKQYNDRALA